MAAHAERPIIFPLSNPTHLMEASASDLIAWTVAHYLLNVLTVQGRARSLRAMASSGFRLTANEKSVLPIQSNDGPWLI
jgi:hypothetical protein